MSYSVLDAIKDTIFNSNTCWATKEEAIHRADICDKCPFKTMMKTCSECGCFLPAKVKYEKSTCPQGKW